MADKYLIYTMGIPEINEAVQKVLIEKGYDASRIPKKTGAIAIGKDGEITYWGDCETPRTIDIQEAKEYYSDCKELTFRELMELPPVHDDDRDLAEEIFATINNHNQRAKAHVDNGSRNWCKVWEILKKKLGV